MAQENTAGKKLIVYEMDMIQNVLNAIRTLKSDNIDESRKHIAIFDALDQNFVQVLDAPAQEAAPAIEITKDPAQQRPPIVMMEENGEDEEEDWSVEDSEKEN